MFRLILLFATSPVIANLYSVINSNEYYPYFKYQSNQSIFYINVIALILTSIILIIHIYYIIKINQTPNLIILLIYPLIIFALFVLMLSELYISTTFYYGEVRDKQNLFSQINSTGFRIIAYFIAVYIYFIFNKMKFFKILNFITFFVNYFLLYEILEYIYIIKSYDWKLFYIFN